MTAAQPSDDVDLVIDGTAGGGQLLRTALSLATITDTTFRIENIRGSRPNPGLKQQHLAAVELVATLCEAAVSGAELDADELTFHPGDVRRTTLEATIPTAGSVMLLFDTVLPIAATMDEPLGVTATGGTNVKWAPTVEYHQLVKLPLLARWGVDATIDRGRSGFYPVGGGTASLATTPATLSAIDLERRGALDRVEIYSLAAESLAEREVAERQATQAESALSDAGFSAHVERVETVPSQSPGSSLLLRGVYERTVVGVDALGERGRPAEDVASGAVDEFEAVHANGAPVDPSMADQVMIFLALAGGRVRIPSVTAHVQTNLALIRNFGIDLGLERGETGLWLVAPSPNRASRR